MDVHGRLHVYRDLNGVLLELPLASFTVFPLVFIRSINECGEQRFPFSRWMAGERVGIWSKGHGA